MCFPFYIRISFLCLIIMGLFRISSSDCRLVNSSMQHGNSQMKITCGLSCPNQDFAVRLNCPLTKSSCAENCNVLFGEIIKCHSSRGPGSINYTYTVEEDNIEERGEWFCTYRNQKGNSITLVPKTKPAPLTTLPLITTTYTVTSSHATVEREPLIPKSGFSDQNKIYTQQKDKKESPNTEHVSRNEKSKPNSSNSVADLFNITQPEIVFILLGVLVVSLLFNVVFIIRCALTKSYIDGMRVGDPDMACLECCLCFNEDPYKKLQRRAPNGFLRGEQVYEDLPGSSVGENSNFYLNNPGYTPRMSNASNHVVTDMIDPNTGMLMMPMTKMNALMNSHSNGGTFPRQHAHQHHLFSMSNGSVPPNNAGYVMAPRRGSIVGGSSNPYVLMSMVNAQETASQTSQHSANSMQTLMARPNSAQILFYEDGTPAIATPGDMQRSAPVTNNAPIYGYTAHNAQTKRCQQGTNTTHTNSVSGDGDTESTVSNATQNTNSNSNPFGPNKGSLMEEQDDERRRQQCETQESLSQNLSSFAPILREQSPPLPQQLEVNTAQPIVYNDNVQLVAVPHSSSATINGGIHSRIVTTTPPLPPYPTLTAEDNTPAYTMDLIQHCEKKPNIMQESKASDSLIQK